MRTYRREARNSRAAILGSFEDFFEENASFDEYIRTRYNRNPFTDEAATTKRKRRYRVTQFMKRYIQRILHIKFGQTQIIYPVIRSASDIPNYETVVPARHVTTTMAMSPRIIQSTNIFRGGIKVKPRDATHLLSSASANSSVNSLFEDDRISLEGTGATTADSNFHIL
ncbi:hypothetical protein I9W82_002830 [Candida metapsilosis]|uniref:Uncharacterized protein n=1 Tax=Candida metapsilosis TaxID=273372 RepID=A0A8H8DAA9_9ASCO|nr:hypothetical protein I9W82_002830 [Candida metapsilosis]